MVDFTFGYTFGNLLLCCFKTLHLICTAKWSMQMAKKLRGGFCSLQTLPWLLTLELNAATNGAMGTSVSPPRRTTLGSNPGTRFMLKPSGFVPVHPSGLHFWASFKDHEFQGSIGDETGLLFYDSSCTP